MTRRYEWVVLSPRTPYYGADICDRCKKPFKVDQAVLMDDYQDFYCSQSCVDNLEQDRAEMANERRYSGEPGLTREDIRERTIQWQKKTR